MPKLTQEQLDRGEVVLWYTFKKYSGLTKWINSKLDSNFKAVFSTKKLVLTKHELNFSGVELMLVKQDLSYVIITNSEWAFIRG